MALTLPGQTLRGVAAKLRQLSYVPTSWQGVLAGLNANGRGQLETFLHDLVREGGTPQLMAMVLEHLADQREAIQRERDAWSFVWSGPEPAHTKTADTFERPCGIHCVQHQLPEPAIGLLLPVLLLELLLVCFVL